MKSRLCIYGIQDLNVYVMCLSNDKLTRSSATA